MAAVATTSQRIRSLLVEAIADDLLEGETELLAEEGVDARIYRGIAVSQPEEHAKDHLVDAITAKALHHVNREERQPTHYETTHDDAQCFGCLRFHADPFHLCVTYSSFR